jgi:hypothetical protein
MALVFVVVVSSIVFMLGIVAGRLRVDSLVLQVIVDLPSMEHKARHTSGDLCCPFRPLANNQNFSYFILDLSML